MRVLSFLLLIFLATNSYSQIPVNYNDDARRVYWFDITVKQIPDPNTKIPTYKIFRMGKQIHYGTAMQYDQYLWNGLSNGSKIAVGPFNSREQAERANILYDVNNSKTDSTLLTNNTTYYWYLVTLKQSKRLKSYQFERIPARVVSGTYSDFFSLMDVSLSVNKLIIGVFEDIPEAENSKRVFRLEE